jgi:hypothetical protein
MSNLGWRWNEVRRVRTDSNVLVLELLKSLVEFATSLVLLARNDLEHSRLGVLSYVHKEHVATYHDVGKLGIINSCLGLDCKARERGAAHAREHEALLFVVEKTDLIAKLQEPELRLCLLIGHALKEMSRVWACE